MRPTNEEITRLIDAARWAPSGDNCQPWNFSWDSKILRVFYDHERGRHPLNPGETASLIALGCLLESIDLAAGSMGYETRARMNSLSASPWAEIEFTPSAVEANPLARFLKERTTDRRLFRGGNLNPEMFSDHVAGDVRLHILNEIDDELLEFILACEMILMEHEQILPSVLNWVRLSQNQARKTADGFSWRNMDARIWELPLIPVLRRFPSVLNLTRPVMRHQHAKRVRQQLQSSAGLICVSTSGDKESLFTVGRLMMKTWLRLTQLGYGVQPLTLSSLLIFLSKLNLLDHQFFSPEFYEDGRRKFARAFKIPDGFCPTWMIRTGIADPLPQALRTYRLPAEGLVKFT